MVNDRPTDADSVASVLAGDRKAFGSVYDRYARLVRAAVCDELRKMIGIVGEPTPEQMCGEKWRKVQRAGSAFVHLTEILAENPDALYHGRTVGPSDKDKVLLRWKLADGRYEVIFGDLRSEVASAERLHALELR